MTTVATDRTRLVVGLVLGAIFLAEAALLVIWYLVSD